MGIFNFFKKRSRSNIERNEIENIEENEKEEIKIEENKDVFEYNFEIDSKTKDLDVEKEEFRTEEMNEEELEYLIIEEILKVIENYTDFESVQDIARKAAKRIGTNNVEILRDYISRGKVSRPLRLKKKYEELGQWTKAVENAVLTILYSFEDKGVDELLKISIIQSEVRFKAINLLCKLASRGIEIEKIIDSIIYVMKPLNEDETLKVISFLSQIKNNGKIQRLLELYYKKYILESNLECAYDVAISKINLRGTYTEDELTFLKVLALHEGKLDSNFLLEGEDEIIDFSNVKEDTRVKAAVSYHSLNKDDKEINYRLIYLKDNSLDEEVREFLSGIINKNM